MEKLFKICCVAGLGVSLLFVFACNEEQVPAPKQTQIVSKPIPKLNSPATQTPFPGDAGKKQAPVSDLKPVKDSVNAGHIGGDIDGAEGLQKVGIFTPLEKYDSKGRVDPFILLIDEKNASAESGSSGESKPKRTLTPLEKLELSQLKLVAIVIWADFSALSFI